MRTLPALALMVTLSLATPRVSEATTVVPVTVAELTRSSDDVVLATVRSQVSRWDGRVIVTDHTLEVVSVLAGRIVPRATVYLRTGGGTVGHISQVIAGVPEPEVGQSYVFFFSGGTGTVRYLAHLTAAMVPLRVERGTGRVEALCPEGLVTVGTTLPATAPPAGRALAFDSLLRAVREARP